MFDGILAFILSMPMKHSSKVLKNSCSWYIYFNLFIIAYVPELLSAQIFEVFLSFDYLMFDLVAFLRLY